MKNKLKKHITTCDHHDENSNYLRELVFGANDGLVTTLALVAGLYAASVSQNIIILAAMVELVGGSVSMALGNYISVKSQMDFFKAQVQREKWEMKNMPDVEREEIRQIYRKKGFKGQLLEQVVKTITSNKKRWLDIMLKEELGITQTTFLNPVKAAFYIGTAFIIAGIIPLISFFFRANGIAMTTSITLSVLFLFGIGVWKIKVTNKKWYKSGFESLLIGALAALAGYGIGLLFA